MADYSLIFKKIFEIELKKDGSLPLPDKLFHVLEDFLAEW